jgi:hypothetical protein
MTLLIVDVLLFSVTLKKYHWYGDATIADDVQQYLDPYCSLMASDEVLQYLDPYCSLTTSDEVLQYLDPYCSLSASDKVLQ